MPFYKPEPTCLLCKNHSEYKFIKDYKNSYREFSLYECLTCHGQFWLPFKNPGADWYEKYDCHNVKDGQPREIHSYHKKFLEINKSFLNNAKTLDLGCGTGEFMAELRKNGTHVFGADIDKEAIKVAKTFFNFSDIYNLPINEFFKITGLPKFDYVTVFEVFEHVDNPHEILEQSKKILNSGGKLVFSLPSRERPFVNLSSWDYPHHHLSRWNEKSIKYLLESFGYEKIKISYINKFNQLYELFLEIIAKTLKFKKAAGLKIIAREEKSCPGTEKSLKKNLLTIIYKTGRFLGVVCLPRLIAAIIYPFVLVFFPRAGIIYIEASKK